MKKEFKFPNVTVLLREQECSGDYNFFTTPAYMTRGFQSFFGDFARWAVMNLLNMIKEKYPKNADYLQVFDCSLCGEEQKVYAFHDGEHITFMLPEEY